MNQLARNDDDNTCGYQARITANLPAGRYYVRLEPYAWRPIRQGDYRLLISYPQN